LYVALTTSIKLFKTAASQQRAEAIQKHVSVKYLNVTRTVLDISGARQATYPSQFSVLGGSEIQERLTNGQSAQKPNVIIQNLEQQETSA